MSAAPSPFDQLPALARAAIAAKLEGRRFEPPPLPDAEDSPHGVFVTLHARGDLRGCIGHIEPTCERLSEEVATVAPLAAFRDPRFPPLRPDELHEVAIEISILTPPEPVADKRTLDPRRYGVVVSSGPRRGVLLPDLEGIDTVEQQLTIALRKGRIDAAEAYAVERFEIVKVEEAR